MDNEYKNILEQILAEHEENMANSYQSLPPPENRPPPHKPWMRRAAETAVRSFRAPGDVYLGKREPSPEMATEMALTFTPMAAPARGTTVGIGLGGPIRTLRDAILAGNPAAVRRMAPEAIADGLIRPEEVRYLVGLATKNKNRLYAQGERSSRLRAAGSSDWLDRMGAD